MDQVDDYLIANDMQRDDMLYLISEFECEILKMRGKCIDIGCGPGLGTLRLLTMLPFDSTITGVDISKAMIECAQKNFAHENRVSFVELDIATRKIPRQLTGVFDSAISVHCIHWCSDLSQVFNNIYKLLRPGGTGLVLFIAKHPLFPVYPRLHAHLEYRPYMKDFAKFIPYLQNDENPGPTVKKMIEESGFEVLHCSHRERTYTFKNWDVVKQYAIAVNPFIERMPEEVRIRYAEDLGCELRNTEHAVVGQHKIMSIYRLLIAYFRKPPKTSSFCKLQ